MNYNELFEKEYLIQKGIIEDSKITILYGNSIVACIMNVAIKELGFSTKCIIFDNGKFVNNDYFSSHFNDVPVILCSSRMLTRAGMKEDANTYFPGANVFDFYAIYHQWITKCIKRKCDYDSFAETLYLCRKDECLYNIDSINTLFCNLKCKECHNGIPQRKEKRKIPVESQIFYLDKITDKLPVSQCNFQGGEVFTDVNFSEFVKLHARNPRIAIFTIATNGTILPNEEMFQVIKQTGAMIRISDYGPISQQKNSIINKCKEYSIPCFTFPMAEKWRKFGEYKKRNRLENDLHQICKSCCFGTHDMMFVEDKLFCCLRTLFADAIGDKNDAVLANTLDLNSEFSLEEFKEFVQGKELWRMCDYCDYPMLLIEPAEQM